MARAISFLLVPSGGVQVVTMQFLLPLGHVSTALAVVAKASDAAPKEACFKSSRREEATPYAFAEAASAAKRMNETANFMIDCTVSNGDQF